MKRVELLRKQQARLKEDISAMLDSFLIGSVGKAPSMAGHNLTTKLQGKTATLYVRKDIVAKAVEMSKRYKKLWTLLQKLSRLNCEILKSGSE